MEILEAAGRTIREKYRNKNKYIKEREAIMFPPAPNLSSFIDAFHRDTLSNKENKEKTEKQRRRRESVISLLSGIISLLFWR